MSRVAAQRLYGFRLKRFRPRVEQLLTSRLEQAPLALVFCAHPARSAQKYGQRGTTLYCVQDATIACALQSGDPRL